VDITGNPTAAGFGNTVEEEKKMRIVFKIAKNEWRYLFYSPIAWFVLLIYWVTWAAFYTDQLADAIASMPLHHVLGLVYGIFIDKLVLGTREGGHGVFEIMIKNFYQFIPIVTMGVFSREITNGTIPLLYSSPIKLRKIVLGKYLGILLFNLLLLAALGVLIITSVIVIKNPDYGTLLSAALGFYLMLCAYSAIGLFLSTLTSYQIIAALGTFIVLFCLDKIGLLWQRYDFIRDLTWWLSSSNRVEKMLTGLITSKDVIYFLTIAGMFLGFILIRLKARREARSWYIHLGRYGTVTAAGLLIGYISSRPILTVYFDATASQRNTIHQRAQQLIRQFGDSTLEVTAYTNLLSHRISYGMPVARNAWLDIWDPYLRFKPDIRFKYEYYYDYDPAYDDSTLFKQYPGRTIKEIAALLAESEDCDLAMFKTPEEMRRIIDLRPEHFENTTQLQYGGRKEFIRSPYPTTFKRLLYPAKIPHVYYLTGELERSILKTGEREYSQNHNWLIEDGFDVDTLNPGIQDIPADATVLVLADPKMDLPFIVQNKLANYIDRGGNMLIIGEPGKQYVVNPFLRRIGIRLMNGQLVEPSFHETFEKVWTYTTSASDSLSEELLDNKKGIGGELGVRMPGVTGIGYARDSSSFVVKPLLRTLPNKTWFKASNDLVIDSTLPPFHPEAGDLKGDPFVTAIQLTRQLKNREQRIVVCSGADFINNKWIVPLFNGLFFNSICSWLDHNEFPVYTPDTPPRDTALRIGRAGGENLRIVYVWVFPAILLLAASVLLIRRKRK
jgi:ABC-2 type transport system permease protein